MSSENTPLFAQHAAIGTYVPAGPGDKRSPCPMINSLANHGYLPRNGQNVLALEMKAAMDEAGISKTLGAVFVNTVYNVHQEKSEKNKAGFLSRLWAIVRDPWTLLSSFGMRRSNQTDSQGRPVLDLDQLALPGAVEHDISLTRRDHAQKEGNCGRQGDLVNDLLACSADGRTITREELAGLRKRRIEKQREENPGLTYGPLQHELACGEIALILGVFGDRKSVPYEYLEPFLREERLPLQEGWKKRRWWTLGLIELKLIATKVKGLVGVQI
ncbi:Cloroperoxidase [Macroventuria anomochaeta]|uniref:Cloroperoxidase n=1 Tax=Macroventuria anomochaeta TaxID=301207 RepID=A0ACB6RRS6_9PLEO|nr:Cloroperoxidase [Macroventuria anomochaeta]KAF2624100.1 Cloroperoxidase [Macroventuria anomochaeta]